MPLQLAFGESVASAGERIVSEFKRVRCLKALASGSGASPPANLTQMLLRLLPFASHPPPCLS